jgi:calcium/calmodulin-dependent protein kinase I
VAILSSLDHLHITSVIDFFEEPDCFYIVMELMSGGDLFDRIGRKKSYSEADARDLVVKLMKAVAICHQNDVAHCDIKPKNLLLASDKNDSFIKLADFGFASRVYKPKSLTKQCGTPFFVAPEILARKPYDMSADIWSAGCIVFLLLSGNLPFKGRTQKELFKNIMKGDFEFHPTEWEGISDDAKNFVTRMLVRNQDDRTTARKALLHPWLFADERRLSKTCLHSTSQRLKTFNAKMKLRSAMIAIDVVSTLKKVAAASSTASYKSFNTSATMSVTTCGTSSSLSGSLDVRRGSLSSNNKGPPSSIVQPVLPT